MLTLKKSFLIKIVQKRKQTGRNQTVKEKLRNQKNKKSRQNDNSKICIKDICQCNYEKKRFIQSFKPRTEILKSKVKIKNIQ